MRFRVLDRLLVLVALALVASTASAADKPKGKGKPGAPTAAGAAAAPGAGDKPFAEWSKLTKDAEHKKGFFTLWKKRDNIYLEIAKEQLDQPFLYVVSVARGIGSNCTRNSSSGM